MSQLSSSSSPSSSTKMRRNCRNTALITLSLCLTVQHAILPSTNAFNIASTTTNYRNTKPLFAATIDVEPTPFKPTEASSSSSTPPSPTITTTSKTVPPTTTTSSTRKLPPLKPPSSLPPPGRWEEMQGNYILRPPPEFGQPRALISFLGGALVGASPHISYRYLLERLSSAGYLIVATPYNLSFDHLATCDAIIGKFERIAPTLARQYGAVPVVGVGHSCGALLQVLITSLFPDTPRAANALLSFNNKPIKEAVPFFDEVFAPLFTAIAAKNETYPSGTEAMALGLELARDVTEGKIPSDDLLSDIAKVATPELLASVLPKNIAIPTELRSTLQSVVEPTQSALVNAGVMPLLKEGIEVAEQLPLLIDEVADGARDFIPPTASVSTAARRAYRARRTLILKYENDGIDESEEIEALLRESERVMRMKRPMINFDLQLKVVKGGHATPLLAPPLDLASRAEDILGAQTARERLLYEETDETVDALLKWLEEGRL